MEWDLSNLVILNNGHKSCLLAVKVTYAHIQSHYWLSESIVAYSHCKHLSFVYRMLFDNGGNE